MLASTRTLVSGYALCLAFFSAAPVLAATPGEQDLIRDRQDRLLEEQRRRLQELKDLPGRQTAPSAPATPTDDRCFDIKRIELKGADALTPAERTALVEPFQGKCLGLEQLNEVLKAVTDHYIDKGLVTSRAYLPQQDLSTGVLQVLVVEGKLENLRSDAAEGFTARELAMTFPGKEGELVNLRELEQMTDQLNRLPSNRAQIELTPGQAIGGSDVAVKNTPDKPWRANLSRNNDGQRSTGEQQWNIGLDWDNPLGLADQVSLRGGHDAISDHDKGSRNALFSYSVPWGWWTFNYLYSETHYRTQLDVGGGDAKQDGDSQNHQLSAERVIHRDALSKTSVNFGLAHLRTNNFFDGNKLELSSNRISEAQVGINHGRRIGSAFLNLDLGMQQGVGLFDAQGRHHLEPGDRDPRYRKYTGTLSYLHPFELWGESLAFTSLATGQRSEDLLFSPQRLSLGGSSSVRGYKDQFLSGDSGGYWRNELRLTRPVTLDWLRPVLAEYGAAIGYDQGVIRNDRYNGDEHGRLTSSSLELYTRGQHVAASVTFAHSLERPDVIDREAPIYFRLDVFL
ncbi:ShlB/FhaC/HecB family hemolysin secretion/activation protein [Pseudomonas cremoricolorata]|uniref:ShlB/FhaC/HecB family hemolysin secretion/activation protein n=1 Tax=Pseudomonas cremoricolorata TaxID=157783 RepID=UPI0006768B0D|nr:ShlB/FhaC/HecB family hemolysin secretion/activation protein [Pseudomonas cremoricolorata]